MKPRIKRSEAFLGIHFDFHAGLDCTQVGKTLTPKMLRDMLELINPDYVQCDCKGHPGLASYPTEVGTPAPGFVRDPLKLWRKITAEYGVSLYMHYSGVVDESAVKQHPDWAARKPDGDPWGQATSVFGPYADELMIPMFKELVDRYRVDGVWVDGECWGVEMDYSDHARRAWKEATGLDEMPVEQGDKHFERFRRFQRDGFKKYLAHYIDTMHDYAPDFEIASNWAFTGHMPEPVSVDMDFISGDLTPRSALSECLMDARLLARQGKPWDLMSWSFNGRWGEPGQSTKSTIQLQQEAAVIMAAGGGYQAYFKQKRDASIFPWTMQIMAEVASFCRARQAYCHRAKAVPQVGLVLSHDGYYKHIDKLMRPWGCVYQAFRGILRNLLDNQNVVDVVMDHHLEQHIERYPLLVLPEWKFIAPALKKHLLSYVEGGGKLLLIGVAPTRAFKKQLNVTLKGRPQERACYVELEKRMGGAKTHVQQVVPNRGTKVCGWLYKGNEPKGERIPAAVIAKLGKGEIAAITMDMGARYGSARTTMSRDFLQSVVNRLLPHPMLSVTGSHQVAVSLMQKEGALMVHLINLGGQHHGGCYTFDEIPPVGPIEVVLQMEQAPKAVHLQPGSRRLKSEHADGTLRISIRRVEVHEIIEIR